MKNSLLFALLSLVGSLMTSSMASADEARLGPNRINHNFIKVNLPELLPHHRLINKLNTKIIRDVTRPHNNIKNRHRNNRHNNRVRHHNRRYNPNFSVTWSNHLPNAVYRNGHLGYGYYRPGYYAESYVPRQTYNQQQAPQRANTMWDRLKRQERKIQKGHKSGHLVPREVKNLRHEQRKIQNQINRYKRDGRFTPKEKSKIHRMLDVSAKNINNQRNNRLTRWSEQRRNQNHSNNNWH